MRVIEVTQFAHSVSFTVEDDQESLCFVEYRRDQVWQDEQGIWQLVKISSPSISRRFQRKQDCQKYRCSSLMPLAQRPPRLCSVNSNPAVPWGSLE